MAQPIQCDNCGSVLLEKDAFCGECGAPGPFENASSTSAAGEVPETPPPSPPETPPASREAGWRVAAIVLGILAAILCLLGVAAFLLFGLTDPAIEGQEAENWLYATFCCLLPIAGTGIILAIAGLGIWWVRLRDR